MPSSQKIINLRIDDLPVLRLNSSLFVFLLVLLVSAACAGRPELAAPPHTPTSSQSPAINPTNSPVPTEPALVPQTSTATQLPAFTPTPFTLEEVPAPLQFPDTTHIGWQLTANGLSSPVGLTNAGDGSGRTFILEQPGKIRVLRDQELLEAPYLDISERVSCCGERGLLGLAFHPNYAENGYIYVNYTDLNGDTVIARFEDAEDRERSNPGSEVKLLVVEQPYANHNGGGMAFGPDGYLYIALGDGGSGGDPLGNAQNTSSLLGKLLRIDVDQVDGYAIPDDNPFVQGGGAPEVWAYGLRNPWRFSFDRLTGDLYIGDVGQGVWEEIDYLPAGSPGGANFGWNYLEASHQYGNNPVPPELVVIDPVAEYGHDQGYSVIGGLVYRGEQLPGLFGIYLYGDYGSGNIWGLFQDNEGTWQKQLLFKTGDSITSFGEDEQGELYYVTWNGDLYQLVNK